MEPVYIVAAKRSAIGRFQGQFKSLAPATLGAQVISGTLESIALDPSLVDQVVMGQVLTAGHGQNPARVASLLADIPQSAPAYLVNQVCGSGLRAIQLAANSILSGEADIVVAGGQEVMSQSAHLLPADARHLPMGDISLLDSILRDGLTDGLDGYHMGLTAENIASAYGIDRAAQDAFALNSQQKAVEAVSQGVFANEIVKVTIPATRKQPAIECVTDEHIRQDASLEQLAKLRAAFKADGSVTAGNASGINDGAACLILASKRAVEAHQLNPIAVIEGQAMAGVDPKLMGEGPIPAVKAVLEKTQWALSDVDLCEFNEAFAAQALRVNDALGIDPHKVNIHGGAIALGHPIGASGARIVVTLLNALAHTQQAKGIAALCVGGGQGLALAVRRLA